MTKPVAFGAQITGILRIGRDHEGDALDDFDARGLEAALLRRVVGEQQHALHPQVVQDRRRDVIGAVIDRQPERSVGVDGIRAVFLEAVSSQLLTDADASTLVTAQVHDDPHAAGRDDLERLLELRATVAAQAAEHVAGEAFAMDAHQHRVDFVELSANQSNVLGTVGGAIGARHERARTRREQRLGDEFDSSHRATTTTIRKSSPRRSTDTKRPRVNSAMVGAPSPANARRPRSPPMNAGARYRTYSSTRPARWNWPATSAPPSTMSCSTPRPPSSSSNAVISPWCSNAGATRAPGGTRPSTTRNGSRPAAGTGFAGVKLRTVSNGSSARTVPAPTTTASLSARNRCASARAAAPVIHALEPS